MIHPPIGAPSAELALPNHHHARGYTALWLCKRQFASLVGSGRFRSTPTPGRFSVPMGAWRMVKEGGRDERTRKPAAGRDVGAGVARGASWGTKGETGTKARPVLFGTASKNGHLAPLRLVCFTTHDIIPMESVKGFLSLHTERVTEDETGRSERLFRAEKTETRRDICLNYEPHGHHVQDSITVYPI